MISDSEIYVLISQPWGDFLNYIILKRNELNSIYSYTQTQDITGTKPSTYWDVKYSSLITTTSIVTKLVRRFGN